MLRITTVRIGKCSYPTEVGLGPLHITIKIEFV